MHGPRVQVGCDSPGAGCATFPTTGSRAFDGGKGYSDTSRESGERRAKRIPSGCTVYPGVSGAWRLGSRTCYPGQRELSRAELPNASASSSRFWLSQQSAGTGRAIPRFPCCSGPVTVAGGILLAERRYTGGPLSAISSLDRLILPTPPANGGAKWHAEVVYRTSTRNPCSWRYLKYSCR